MRHTSIKRRGGRIGHATVFADPSKKAAVTTKVTPDPDNGLFTCPVCGGGAPVVPWASVRSLVDLSQVPKGDRVPRMASHPYGGRAGKQGRVKIDQRCSGSHAIPVERPLAP